MEIPNTHPNHSGETCRDAVETAMDELFDRLELRGMLRVEIALTLADAAEDYVIRLAHRLNDKDTGETRH